MFSFLKFWNPVRDADADKKANGFGGKTLNLNGLEARPMNLFNTRPPVARKPTRTNNSSYSSDCKETVVSPGFSYRIAQRAREVRSTTPGTNSSTSYTLENSLNSTNTTDVNNTSRDVYDKKRKLMETLENFGVRKRTRLESGVDAIASRRRRTISESNTPERITVMHECNSYRPSQPALTSTCLKTISLDNKNNRQGNFESVCRKKQRTRNNEILSSYSSSKFLLKPGQKRSYQADYEDESPKRKHCKSCTCCGSTVRLENDQNNRDKSDKTTETDLSDDLVTVAAGRIFNRSGKPQVVKKKCMKTILDEVLDDDDPTPYTSIEKVREKKKKAQKKIEQYAEKSNTEDNNCSADSVTSVPSTLKFIGVQPAETGILSGRSSTGIAPVATIAATPLTSGLNLFENTAKTNEENKSSGSLQFNFGSPKVNAESSVESSNKKTDEVNGKSTDQSPESINKPLTFQMPKSTVEISDKQSSAESSNQLTPKSTGQITGLLSRSPDKNDNVSTKDASSSFTLGSQTDGSPKPPTFTFGAPKPLTNSTPLIQFGVSKSNNQPSSPVSQTEKSQVDREQSTPVMKFGGPKIDDKPSTPTMQFGAPKVDDLKSTPAMQFGAPKVDGVKSTPAIQFGTSKADDIKSTPVMQFGAPKVDGTVSTPVMQFGAPKVDGKQSTPIMQFGAPKSDNQQSAPLQFGSNKESENAAATSLFSFGNNDKSSGNTKSVEPFQFGSQKSGIATTTESKIAGFGSTTNSVQNQNLFSFGKTDPPKYDAAVDKSAPKLQFGAVAAPPVFGTSNVDQSKAPVDNQGSKLVFGGQITNDKPATSAPGMLFTNNATNPIFQFSTPSSKPNDKPSEVPNSTFSFSSTKAAPAFGTSAPQDFGSKPMFQFSSPKTEESKTQFSVPTFGSQSTTVAPFKFGGDNKSASFGNTFPPTSQPLQFTNNPEKPTAEPFKFGSAAPSNNSFQFSANKVESGPVKFGQNSSTFPTPAFGSSFGNPAPQQSTTFGGVQPPQPSPFGGLASPSAAPAFGSVPTPSSNAFGTSAPNFQFGSTINAPSTSSTFAFGTSSQSAKPPDSSFNFNAPPKSASPFQFGQTTPALSTPQFGGTPSQGAFGFGSPPMGANAVPGSSQPLFSMGTAPAGERRKVKAVRRRQ